MPIKKLSLQIRIAIARIIILSAAYVRVGTLATWISFHSLNWVFFIYMFRRTARTQSTIGQRYARTFI